MDECGYCGAQVERLVLGRRCAECCRRRQQEWRDKNRERLRAQAATRRVKKADEISAYAAEWYARHPEYGRGGGHVSGTEHPRYKHGLSRTPEHAAWKLALRRCTNEKDGAWQNYGGRGIRMCPEWAASFEAFLAHIGPRPSAEHSLDRIDNSRGYEPGNVRWATKQEQDRNRRTTKLTEAQVAVVVALRRAGGELIDIAKRYGITKSYVSHLCPMAKKRRLTPKQTEEILARRERGETTVAIAADYGIRQSYVSTLMRRHGRAAYSK